MSYPPPPQYGAGDYQPSGQPTPYSPQPQPTGPFAPLPPAPPPARPRSGSTPLLVAGLVAAVLAAGLMLVLWLVADGERSDAQDLADTRQEEISDLQSERDSLQEQLQQAESDYAELESQIGDFESEVGDLETARTCIEQLEAFFDTEVGSAEEDAAWEELHTDCSDWVY